jgi:hypothetical protein
MAVINTGNFPKALWPGVHAFCMGLYNEWPEEYSRIFKVETSDLAYEEDVEITAFDLPQVKTEGAAVVYTGHSQGFTKRYTHIAYGLGFIVTHEEMSDNQYKRAFQRAEMLARSFRLSKEIVHANILDRAFTGAYAGGDGKELVATDHPTVSGNQSNELAVAADLSEASLEDALTLTRKMKNSKGQPINLKPKMLIVSAEDAFTAERILKSDGQSGTANNDINAIRSRGLLPQGYMISTYKTDTDAWFVTNDCPHGLMSFTREGYRFTKDGDFDTDNAKFKGYERYVPGWTDWRGLVGSPGV